MLLALAAENCIKLSIKSSNTKIWIQGLAHLFLHSSWTCSCLPSRASGESELLPSSDIMLLALNEAFAANGFGMHFHGIHLSVGKSSLVETLPNGLEDKEVKKKNSAKKIKKNKNRWLLPEHASILLTSREIDLRNASSNYLVAFAYMVHTKTRGTKNNLMIQLLATTLKRVTSLEMTISRRFRDPTKEKTGRAAECWPASAASNLMPLQMSTSSMKVNWHKWNESLKIEPNYKFLSTVLQCFTWAVMQQSQLWSSPWPFYNSIYILSRPESTLTLNPLTSKSPGLATWLGRCWWSGTARIHLQHNCKKNCSTVKVYSLNESGIRHQTFISEFTHHITVSDPKNTSTASTSTLQVPKSRPRWEDA